jgi:BCD family chlorophyll transporter-like MFS transporter
MGRAGGGGAAFLLVGAGLHSVQTVGLALATDLAPREAQPKVVALLSVMLLVGMVVSAAVFGALLAEFSQLRLIQVIQGAAVLTMVLNCIAMWKQEARDPSRTRRGRDAGGFRASWRTLRQEGPWGRRLLAAGLGTAAFGMQDVLLEPYGGQILHLGVGATTALTALLAGGGVAGFVVAARALGRGADPHRAAGFGVVVGVMAFSAVVMAAPVGSVPLFSLGCVLIGLGTGVFAHATLTACMRAAPAGQVGLALGAWGAVQASAAGLAIAAGGLLRDTVGHLALIGTFGDALATEVTGYGVVYLVEIALLFVTLAVLGPLVRPVADEAAAHGSHPTTA